MPSYLGIVHDVPRELLQARNEIQLLEDHISRLTCLIEQAASWIEEELPGIEGNTVAMMGQQLVDALRSELPAERYKRYLFTRWCPHCQIPCKDLTAVDADLVGLPSEALDRSNAWYCAGCDSFYKKAEEDGQPVQQVPALHTYSFHRKFKTGRVAKKVTKTIQARTEREAWKWFKWFCSHRRFGPPTNFACKKK